MKHGPHLSIPVPEVSDRRDKRSLLRAVYITVLFVALNHNITVWVNSGFLANFLEEKNIGLVYAASSVIALLVLVYVPKALRRFGGYHLTVFFLALGIASSLMLAFTSSAWVAVTFFITQILVVRLANLDIDLFLKNLSNPKHTGTFRGILYTVINTASVVGPLLAAWLVTGTEFRRIYLASAGIFLGALVFFLLKFKHYRDAKYLGVNFGTAFRHLRASLALRKAVFIRFALSFFSAWNSIYIPLYLVSSKGFSWREVNLAFAIVLFVYLIIELPLGKLADKYFAEKKIMLGGSILAILVSVAIPLVAAVQFWSWIPILVLLGIGFCSIEIGIETYFFRRVHEGESGFVSIFRMADPAAFIISTLTASAFLAFAPLQYLFWLLVPVLVWQVWVIIGKGRTKQPKI